jgi:hypothetical protein
MKDHAALSYFKGYLGDKYSSSFIAIRNVEKGFSVHEIYHMDFHDSGCFILHWFMGAN